MKYFIIPSYLISRYNAARRMLQTPSLTCKKEKKCVNKYEGDQMKAPETDRTCSKHKEEMHSKIFFRNSSRKEVNSIMKIHAAGVSKTSVLICQNTLLHIPEDCQ
jgi:hypothetical protein